MKWRAFGAFSPFFVVANLTILASAFALAASRTPSLTMMSPFNSRAVNNTVACASPMTNAVFIASQNVATIVDTATNTIVMQTAYPFDPAMSCILLCLGMGLDASGADVYLVGYTDSNWNVPYAAFLRASNPPEWSTYTLPASYNSLGGYAADFATSRLWLTTQVSVKLLRYSLGDRGVNVTFTEMSSVATIDKDTWFLRFITASNQLFVVTTDLKSFSRITEIRLLPSDGMLLLTNNSAVVPAAFPYYFAPTCTKEGCSLSLANKDPQAFVIATNTHVFTVKYSSSAAPGANNELSYDPRHVLVLVRTTSQQGCSCPVTGFMFVADTSGRWTCIDTLSVPARIVDSDFVGSNWQGAPAPVMLGGEGPWHDYAHACAIHSGKVFLAGVFTVGKQAPASNSLGSLALPAAADVAPSAALPPAVIAGISLAVLAHFINFAAVVYFVRRHCSPAPSRIFIWCLVAFFFSVLAWLPLLVPSCRQPPSKQQLLKPEQQHQKLTVNFKKEAA